MRNQTELLPLAVAFERVTDQRPNSALLHRWRTRGIHGVRLETSRRAGQVLTTESAVRHFLQKVKIGPKPD